MPIGGLLCLTKVTNALAFALFEPLFRDRICCENVFMFYYKTLSICTEGEQNSFSDFQSESVRFGLTVFGFDYVVVSLILL